ncbi:MAG: tetratricopeptide repeat protein [Longimicrobiales bacterium]
MSVERGLKDVDTAGHAHSLRAALWALLAGSIFGMLGVTKFGVVGLVVGWLVGGSLIYIISKLLAARVANAAASIYMSSGSSTPAQREYSLGDALVAQGKLSAAVREFERCVAAYPSDPEPRLRLARLHRDRLQQPETAADWFKQVVRMPTIAAATEAMAARELIELYTHRLRDPTRALPELARLAQRQPQTAAGGWARTELAELKRSLHSERGRPRGSPDGAPHDNP